MRWLLNLILVLLTVGTLRVVGCGDESPCGDCNDGNPCTRDVCDSYNTSGTISCDPEDIDYRCVHPSVQDGTSCGGGNVCVSGACSENLCADVECDDGNACTVDERCDYVDGTCHYTPVNCGVDSQCSMVGCDSAVGCTYTPVNEGEMCWAGYDPNWRGGVCEAGACVGPCDPASSEIHQCPVYVAPNIVCCPGREYCYGHDAC
jgi:hypothetical protein